ncbi:hypothetical protein FKM82_016429 [Ascaphus truei]
MCCANAEALTGAVTPDTFVQNIQGGSMNFTGAGEKEISFIFFTFLHSPNNEHSHLKGKVLRKLISIVSFEGVSTTGNCPRNDKQIEAKPHRIRTAFGGQNESKEKCIWDQMLQAIDVCQGLTFKHAEGRGIYRVPQS